MIMKKLIAIVLLFYFQISLAQEIDFSGVKCSHFKQKLSKEMLDKSNLRFPGDGQIDVNYYFLHLKIDPNRQYLTGEVTGRYTVNAENVSSFFLDLNNAYTVDSVILNGQRISFSHSSNKIDFSFSEGLSKGENIETKVYYRGTPPRTSDGLSIEFDTHGNNQSVIWTLSEPYDAPSWWPCIDNPADKADSCDVWITLPSFYTSVSQGNLEEIQVNSDGTHTTKWKHRYPIAHYLISIAASNYQKLERYFTHSETDSMLVVDYLYPETLNNPNVGPLLNLTVPMLELFSAKFGEYPFIKEKYGHAMFGFGGGMEHQTISSMGGFSFGLIAHELAHQWFGDKVTCKTWRDIWVNEGFAEFGDLYAVQQLIGEEAYKKQVSDYMTASKKVTGTIAIENTSSVSSIFNYAKTYQKGSLVLHMLRGVMGEELFFSALKEYQTTEFAYGAATIEDFQMVAERVYGESLDWFFTEWLFGTGYPIYSYSWQQIGQNVNVLVKHQGSSGTTTFTMPVQFQLNYEDGTSEIETVMVDKNQVMIELTGKSGTIKSIDFDPNNLIIKDVTELQDLSVLATEQNVSSKLYPNPAQELIQFSGIEELNDIQLFDQSGRVKQIEISGNAINIKYLPVGRYFIHFNTDNTSVVKSFIKN